MKILFGFFEALFCFRRRIFVPRGCVVRIKKVVALPFAFRFPGISVPGLFCFGTYYTRKGKEFWAWIGGRSNLEIHLVGHEFRKIILPSGEWLSVKWVKKKL